MKYLIANWKAQMTGLDIDKWLGKFVSLSNSNINLTDSLNSNKLTIIISPPFPFLSLVKAKLAQLPDIKIACQTLSNVPSGKYTGEVTAEAVKDFAQYAIIGHSERRINYKETEEDIEQKLDNAVNSQIEAILCVRGSGDKIYNSSKIIAYEPVEAIGTGENAKAKQVVDMKGQLKLSDSQSYLYGGSADSNNIQDYLVTGQIDGFLVGTASLDPQEFFQMAAKMV